MTELLKRLDRMTGLAGACVRTLCSMLIVAAFFAAVFFVNWILVPVVALLGLNNTVSSILVGALVAFVITLLVELIVERF